MKVEEEQRLKPAVLGTVLAGYLALVLIAGAYHEMWRDEVRAFSVATASSSWSALLSELKYDGHPILWYAVLRVGFVLTHSNLVLPVAAAIIAASAALVILRYAPFPLWLRLLSVFGAFLGYELSVSARNYGLGVLLMMTSCLAFSRRAERPVVLGISLFLLANTSIHAALAALVLLLYWSLDLRRVSTRAEFISMKSLVALAIALAGVAFAMLVSKPPPDMAWSVSISNLDYHRVAASIFTDPGHGLRGYMQASIAAVSEMPWRLVGIDPAIVSRIVVDLCIGWLFFSLRRHPRALVTLIVAIIGFAIFFRNIYTASLRHEGIVLFLIFAICWLEADRVGDSRRIALGLMPLFAVQSLALPFLIQREIRYPLSSSKAFGGFIRANPRYNDAVLMAEPDYMMEAMPYYVANRIFMPRQREFARRVYFGVGGRRQADMSLSDLMKIADSVSCSAKKPVLLAIGYPRFQLDSTGVGHPVYRGLSFTWSPSDWRRIDARHPVASFPRAVTDESYVVYELGCRPVAE